MKYLLFFLLCSSVWAADNSIVIDQIGDNNTVVITQDGTAHSVNVTMGTVSSADNNSIAITQQGTGAKTVAVELRAGINNGVIITQDGGGAHVSNIQNLNGNANNITIGQSGNANHNFTIIGGAGTVNGGNTITATQTGAADKAFTLNLNSTSGAGVTVQQTNPGQANTGNMSISCAAGTCGNYSYTRP
jgi:hypothetical protein